MADLDRREMRGQRSGCLLVCAVALGIAGRIVWRGGFVLGKKSPEVVYDYDLFVVGGGSAGVRLARWSASQYGARVALVDLPFALVSSKKTAGGIGGTCVIRGCVPKKLLIYGSSFEDSIRDAAGYGWSIPMRPAHHWSRLMSAKNAEVSRLNTVYKDMLGRSNVSMYEGYARIVGPHTVDISGRRFTARHLCVATGSRASVLSIPGNDLPGVITSDEALVLPRRPDKLVIVGAGYIGVEFAGFFHGYGTEVHLIFRSDLPLRGFDEDVRAHVLEQLKSRGIHVHAGEKSVSIEAGKKDRLIYKTDAGTVLEVDNVLFATGRRPNTGQLGLEEMGVEIDPRRGNVVVNDYSQTSVDSIYAVGDVTGRVSLTPVALMEGMALSITLFGGKPTTANHEDVPTAVFSQPPVATCGLTEAAAATKYRSVDVYISKFRPLKHSMPTGRAAEERVMLKMVVVSDGYRGAGRVVGLHMVGDYAAEVMQALAVAMRAGASKATFDSTIAIHPT
eukprot:CAMPEP_0170614276 /NCGR_PEP_ID=MMETSP0224-20130122/24713_1 /TAXON_ID=285029 /ORGANISM="Togula jolla, Strain CCCM 725" /LENGTH=504 /DNA_ID=CAMNT_0010939921 /DNA_START=33 /DNA_END=1544 /DNA_ORIENTATION=-